MQPWPFRLRSPIALPFLGFWLGEVLCYQTAHQQCWASDSSGMETALVWVGGLGLGVVVLLRPNGPTWRAVLFLTSFALGGMRMIPEVRLGTLPPLPSQNAAPWTCVIENCNPNRFDGFDCIAICSHLPDSKSQMLRRMAFHSAHSVAVRSGWSGWGRWVAWRQTDSFDERAFQQSQGLCGRLEWLVPPTQTRGMPMTPWDRFKDLQNAHFEAVRQQLERGLVQFGNDQVNGLLWGLATGSKSMLTHEVKKQFAGLGLAHVLAVSGYHVGLVGALAFVLIRSRFLGLRWVGLPGIFVVWWYVGLCGFPVSAIRAALMASLFALGIFTRIPFPSFHTWCLAGWGVALWSPLASIQLGAQLSFLAVLGIFLGLEMALPFKKRWQRWALKWTTVPIAAQLATTPLTIVSFHTFPTYFLPVNMVAGPWVTAIGYGLGMGCLTSNLIPESQEINSAIWTGVVVVTTHFLAFVSWASSLPGVCWDLSHWNEYSGILFGMGLASASAGFIRRETGYRRLLTGCALLAFCALPWTFHPQPSSSSTTHGFVHWSMIRGRTPHLKLVGSDWCLESTETNISIPCAPEPSPQDPFSLPPAGAVPLEKNGWIGWMPGAFWSFEWDRIGLGKWTVYPAPLTDGCSTDSLTSPHWTPWVAWHPDVSSGPWHLVEPE